MTMTDPEITGLARECVNDIYKDVCEFLHDHPKSTAAGGIINLAIRDTEAVLRWLSQRYCLVEKSKARQVNRCIKTKAVQAVMCVLFPDLGKEVEE